MANAASAGETLSGTPSFERLASPGSTSSSPVATSASLGFSATCTRATSAPAMATSTWNGDRVTGKLAVR